MDLRTSSYLYYETMSKRPEFPKLILKVLALNQGPGRRFIQQLLERGRTRGARKVEDLKSAGQVTPSLDPDIVQDGICQSGNDAHAAERYF